MPVRFINMDSGATLPNKFGDSMSKTINGEDCVQWVKVLQPCTASVIAFWMGADKRAVVTALRKPVKDGRVTISDERRLGSTYKFVSGTPAKAKGGAA